MKTNEFELNTVDSGDLQDVLQAIEKSFDIKITTELLSDVNTFGDLSDVLISEVHLRDTGGCTTQQAFYKLRSAIGKVTSSNPKPIIPESPLASLLPNKKPAKTIKYIEDELGFTLNVLDAKRWINILCFVFLICSFILWGFNGKLGFIVTCICLVAWRYNRIFGQKVKAITLGELACKISREHYLKSRRDPHTVNKKEMEGKIKDLFVCYLGISLKSLDRDVPLV